MRRPYEIAVRSGDTVETAVQSVKRDAIRVARRTAKRLGEGARCDVAQEGFGLVYQGESYRTPGGAVKVRALEL